MCVVFNPGDPTLRTLTPSAWLLLELCDGRSEAAVRVAYLAAVAPVHGEAEAGRWFAEGIAGLRDNRLIETSDAGTPAGA